MTRFKSDEERTPVYLIVDETFPHLLNIFNNLVQIANPSIEAAALIKLICKIFWSSIYVRAYDTAIHNTFLMFLLSNFTLFGFDCVSVGDSKTPV